jgi:magnesium transporter
MATAVEFDFSTKRERSIPVESVAQSCNEGLFCWIDMDVTTDRATTQKVLNELQLSDDVISAALGHPMSGRHETHDDLVHFDVTNAWIEPNGLALSKVDALLGPGFFVTLRRGDVEFVRQVHRTYRADFVRFAVSPGFLIYEFWDHLVSSYRKTTGGLGDRVRRVQDEIFGSVDDSIFGRVAEISRDLLTLRHSVLSAREVLSGLATRRSAAVPDSTRPFLEKLVGALERVGADLTVERETLSETLNLYMGIVSHRTNKVVNRLTVVSLVFLPLTFLCGVYGMNFEFLPEFKWRYGYLYFWVLSSSIATATLVFMKKRGWW